LGKVFSTTRIGSLFGPDVIKPEQQLTLKVTKDDFPEFHGSSKI